MISFSIVIPSFNGAQVIERSLKSVFAQTYANWEIIIVDDGSTDNTADAIQPFLSDERIHYFKKENGGVCAARNFGAERANGKYIIFLDNDDEALPVMLKTYQELIGKSSKPLGIAFASRIETDTNKTVVPKNGGYFLSFLKKSVIPGTYCVRKKLFLDSGGFDTQLKQSENWDLLIRLTKYCSAQNIPTDSTVEVVIYYHRHFTDDKFDKRMEDRIEANKIIFEKYKALQLFPEKKLIDFSEKVAKLSWEYGSKKEAIHWQFISVKAAPFFYKPYLKLFKYLLSK